MGFRTKVSGANFAGLRPISHVPENMGITGWFWHGGNLEQTCHNWANPYVPAEVVSLGNARPALMASYMQTKDTTGWLNARVAETESFTLFSVARAPSWPIINGPTFIASATLSAPSSGALMDVSSNGVRGGAYLTVESAPALRTSSDEIDDNGTVSEQNRIKNWAFYATTFSVGSTSSQYKLFVPTRGYSSPFASSSSVIRLISPNPYHIGGHSDSGRGQVCDIAFTAMSNQALTQSQVYAVYNQVKGAAKRRGIEI